MTWPTRIGVLGSSRPPPSMSIWTSAASVTAYLRMTGWPGETDAGVAVSSVIFGFRLEPESAPEHATSETPSRPKRPALPTLRPEAPCVAAFRCRHEIGPFRGTSLTHTPWPPFPARAWLTHQSTTWLTH